MQDTYVKHRNAGSDRMPDTSSLANAIVSQLDLRHTNAMTPQGTLYRNEFSRNERA
jgi:hypothetical protein